MVIWTVACDNLVVALAAVLAHSHLGPRIEEQRSADWWRDRKRIGDA